MVNRINIIITPTRHWNWSDLHRFTSVESGSVIPPPPLASSHLGQTSFRAATQP